MKVLLILEKKRKRVWTSELRGPVTTLGRAVGCTVRIPSSQVSRLHCRLRVENGQVTVEDLESINGTFVNGERVRGIEVVRPGDRLNLGTLSFVVEYDSPSQLPTVARQEEDYPLLEVIEDDPPVAEPLDIEEVGDDVVVLEEDNQMSVIDDEDLGDFLIDLDEEEDNSQGR